MNGPCSIAMLNNQRVFENPDSHPNPLPPGQLSQFIADVGRTALRVAVTPGTISVTQRWKTWRKRCIFQFFIVLWGKSRVKHDETCWNDAKHVSFFHLWRRQFPGRFLSLLGSQYAVVSTTAHFGSNGWMTRKKCGYNQSRGRLFWVIWRWIAFLVEDMFSSPAIYDVNYYRL